MPKHNNAIPNAHFHKDWQLNVKTWFEQPARKLRRRKARLLKAKKNFPRPVDGALRPVVHAPTIKYNRKLRVGRGFSIDELKEAKIDKHFARTIGIAVDHRRRNKSEKSLRENVQRLKLYKSKLVLFPRHKKTPKKQDSPAEALTAVAQLKGAVLPLHRTPIKLQHRKITDEERKSKKSVFAALQKARADARYAGIRKKRKDQKEAEKPAASS